jgi:multiple sugar transport system substrate-binding protein
MSEQPKKLGRRTFLNYAIAVVATGVIVGAGTYLALPKEAVEKTVTSTVTTTVERTVTSTVTPGTQTTVTPSEKIEDFLAKVSGPYRGQTVRIVAESTASSMWLNETKRAKFEEITGIKIEYELLGWDDVMRKALLDAQQKAGAYDLYYIDEGEIMAADFENGYILDWYKFANEHKDLLWPYYDVGDLIPVRYFTYNGMLAGFPFEHFLRLYVYRRDLFEDPKEKADFKARYGWDLRPARTWDEYRQIAEFFTRPDEDLYGHVCQPNPMSLPCDIFVGLAGYGITSYGYTLGRRASYKNGGLLDSAGAVAWLKRYIDLLQFGPKGIENFTWDDEGASYTTGRVAQGWLWTENFSYIQDPEKSKVAGNILCFVPPVEPKYWRFYVPTIYADAGVYAIAASGNHKEAAFLWGQYVSSQEMQVEQMKTLRGVCTRNSLLWSSLADELDAKYKMNIYAMMRRAWTEGLLMGQHVPMAEEPVARDILWKLVVDAIAGKTTPESALSEAAAAIDEKWKSMGWPDLKGY